MGLLLRALPAGPNDPLLLALPFALFFGGSLVVLFFPFGEPYLQLDPAFRKMKVHRDERESCSLRFSDQSADLRSPKKQLARASRIWIDMGRGCRERADMAPDQVGFVSSKHHVGFLDLSAARPDGFGLPALQHDPRLDPLLDEIIVSGFSIFDDAHGSSGIKRAIVAGFRVIAEFFCLIFLFAKYHFFW